MRNPALCPVKCREVTVRVETFRNIRYGDGRISIIGERKRANLVAIFLYNIYNIYIYIYIYLRAGAAHTVMFYVFLNQRTFAPNHVQILRIFVSSHRWLVRLKRESDTELMRRNSRTWRLSVQPKLPRSTGTFRRSPP